MPPITAAIVLSLLVMGGIGAFVLFPIFCINLFWNAIVAHFTMVPAIAIWQASLLYIAMGCIAYLLGLVQIEFRAETVD
jgi:hypothetical protein